MSPINSSNFVPSSSSSSSSIPGCRRNRDLQNQFRAANSCFKSGGNLIWTFPQDFLTFRVDVTFREGRSDPFPTATALFLGGGSVFGLLLTERRRLFVRATRCSLFRGRSLPDLFGFRLRGFPPGCSGSLTEWPSSCPLAIFGDVQLLLLSLLRSGPPPRGQRGMAGNSKKSGKRAEWFGSSPRCEVSY
jgi:hypothetical protein